tara:strand:+ start:475 stop:960 length:486 start_codon:yes stop_codon:yes gene_type:complete
MLSDPQFWVALAFVVFIIAIFNPVRKILSSSLDIKINEIKNSIEEAENLKNETQEALSNIRKRQSDVKNEIENFNKSTKEKINMLEKKANEKLDEQTTKRELLAKEKIEQLTRDVNLEIQQYITKTAIDATMLVVKKRLDTNEKQSLIDQSIKDLGTILKN